jgi:cullin-4
MFTLICSETDRQRLWDDSSCLQTSGVRSLWDLGLQLFRTHLESGSEISRKVIAGLLSLLEKER